uniref:beta-1,3-glucan-binding protein-like n=1 Tax=Styela clava TaxID=7725 RepID=UPI001939B45D|nr:beta-1,3-glucan-binding protein-like [Styela clava]
MESCILFLLFMFTGLSFSCKQSSTTPTKEFENVIFYDEFDTLDLGTWQHEITAGGGGNWEFQYYTNNRSNSYVKDGVLYLKPTLTSDKYDENFVKNGTLSLEGSSPANMCTGRQWHGCERTGNYDEGTIVNPIQSARLRTVESLNFRFGKVEIEAQLPAGDWIWPAIWMLPTTNAYGDWPASGEIDIMESRGNMNLSDASGKMIGAHSSGSTLHWGPYWPWNNWFMTHNTKTLTDSTFADDFHKYTLEWRPSGLKFYIDDENILNVAPNEGQSMYEWGDFATKTNNGDNPWVAGSKLAPFDQKYYLILNVAVGGTTGFFPDDANNYNGQERKDKPWANNSPTAAKDFWDKKDDWYPTWQGEKAAMKIKYVKVTEYNGAL